MGERLESLERSERSKLSFNLNGHEEETNGPGKGTVSPGRVGRRKLEREKRGELAEGGGA